jgi:hypothetical protein
MSQVINFPTSMNLSNVKETAEPTMRGDFMAFQSQNQTYGARDTIRIPISNAANVWLHGNDSFLSLRVKITAEATGGLLSLDASCYSIFKNARLVHAGNILVEQNECGRLWNALFDIQVSAADRASKEITHGIIDDAQLNRSSGLFGTAVASDKYLYFCFPIPMSIVGTLSEKSFPLGALSTGLMLEFDIEDLNKMVTTRAPAATTVGAQSTNTALILTSVQIDQIYYHAKVSNVGIYNNVLMSALGPSVVIAGTEYRSDKKEVPAGTNALTTNFSFPLKSAKSILFWFTNSATANGTITTVSTSKLLNSAISQRGTGGNLKNYYISVDGVNFPSLPVDCSAGSDLTLNTRSGINGSIALNQLLRCYNANSSIQSGGVLSQAIYNSSVSTWVGDYSTKRTVLGLDLDRGSNDGDKYFQGINIQNSTIALRVEWNTGPAESQILYTYVMHDVGFVIENGVCIASR